jgi:hypothetical protein
MMLRLQMLPAARGDSLWLECGTRPKTQIVIIDGGLRETAAVLRKKMESAWKERGTDKLEVELLVVTHYDNDHILGIIELLGNAPAWLHVKDVWFNGRPQLRRLPAPPAAAAAPEDLLGPQESDALSKLLADRKLPWNHHPRWNGDAVVVPDKGDLPNVTLGDLKLTILGPTLTRLYDLCVAWPDVLGGKDEPEESEAAGPSDLLGRSDTWPPVWQDGEKRDPSKANGSSIMLLAEYGNHKLLLTGDGYGSDIAAAVDRFRRGSVFSIDAFKLPHHASANNLGKAVLEKIDCKRYLISTDGSTHRHPDHQALLRILRYSDKKPELLFNYSAATTLPWRDSKDDVVSQNFQDYDTGFPTNASDGLILDLE